MFLQANLVLLSIYLGKKINMGFLGGLNKPFHHIKQITSVSSCLRLITPTFQQGLCQLCLPAFNFPPVYPQGRMFVTVCLPRLSTRQHIYDSLCLPVYPLTCPAWEALPVAKLQLIYLLGVIGTFTLIYHVKGVSHQRGFLGVTA